MTNHPLVSDPKEKNLYWRGSIAYFRKQLLEKGKKKDHWESMGELSPETARRLVRDKRKTAAEKNYLERWDLNKMRTDVSTFGELFAAYDAYTAGIDIDAGTVRANKAAMGNCLRVLFGKGFEVEAGRVSLINAQAITDYEAKTIANRKAKGEAEGWDRERLESEIQKAKRTAGSTWRQAKSLFAANALSSTAYKALVLPDLAGVLPLQSGASSIVAYRRPPQSVLDAIIAAVPGFKATNPARWLAINLEANIGMRRKSCVFAKWDWLQPRGVDLEGVPVWMMRVNVAKGNTSEVRIDPAFALELLALKQAGQEFILPGDEDARDKILADLVGWLRDMGLHNYEKPNHELRKWCVDTMHKTHGIDEAQSMAGHGDQKLTRAVYVSHKTTKSVRVV